MLSTSMESLHLVSVARSARKENTVTPMIRGTRNPRKRERNAEQKETSVAKEGNCR